MERWRGRTALVTGASSGIGKCLAIRLLNHGLNVVACARRVDVIESIRNEVDTSDKAVGELMAVKCDVSKEEDILEMFNKIKESKFGGVDICINNAGFGIMGNLSTGSTEAWRGMLKVNVLGLSICTREALKSMKEREVDDGHIIHISSVGGHEIVSSIAFYCSTKWMVRALTEGLRQELLAEKSGIRVTEISPGLVKTAFAEVAAGKEAADQFMSMMPFLLDQDVCSAVEHALAAPKHVQIHDIILRPIQQPETA